MAGAQCQVAQRAVQVVREQLGELPLQGNEGVLHHIVPANARQRFQCMARREDHHEGQLEQRLCGDVRARRALGPHAKIHLAAGHARQHAVHLAVGQPHLHVRMGVAECGDHLGQQRAGHELRGRDAHHAFFERLQIVDAVQHAFEVLQDLVHQRIEAAPRFRQPDAPRAALDQAHAQGLFQLLDLPAQGRLRHMQRGGGLGEAAGAHQRHQGAQLPQGHIHMKN